MGELRVDLASFQGPLDLLLHLVQQEEVDIHDIPLAKIADRFLAAVQGQVDKLDVDDAGDYLVLASQLLVLKSRALLPRETPVDLEEIDPRLDLVKELLEYRDFKRVAGVLDERRATESLRAPVRVKGPGRMPPADEDLEVDLYALVSSFQRLLRETGATEAVAMPRERLPITHFVGLMFDRLTEAGGDMSFNDLLGAERTRTYVIGAFLALLELIKLRKVRALQDGVGEIRIAIRTEGLEVEGEVDRDLVTETIDQPELGGSGRTRVVYMGSPEFAVPALHALVGAGLAPVLVVTPPPRPSGRGRRKAEVPLAKEAVRCELPLLRTGDVNGRTSREAIEEATPDVIITAGFGQKLGGALLTLPSKACVNLHTSLLPRYRGASPVYGAIREGADRTGVTIFVMDAELDHGPIVAQAPLELKGDETATEVTVALAALAAELLIRTLPSYMDGEIEPTPQNHDEATYVPRLTKAGGRIPWSEPASAVRNHIRAVTDWPGATTSWQPKVKHDPLPLRVTKAEVLDRELGEPTTPGTVLAASADGLDVACGEGVLRIVRLVPAGGRAMAVRDFLNARRVVAGDRLL